MSAVDCPNCGASVPATSRFCPECGRPLAADSPPTAVYDVAPRRLWPPDPLLVVVILIAAGAVILLVGGEWAWGLVVLLLAGLVFLTQREVERRAAGRTLAALGARFSAQRDVLSARSRGQLELFRARRDLAELEAQRGRCYADLGRAVWGEDEKGMEGAKSALGDLVERIHAKEAEIEILIAQIDERVRRAQAGVAPTEMMESPPEPARVPEPWPPPDEGDPPEPAIVPEPSPDEPPPEPERPPTPQGKRGAKGR
ncbi:MAG TPA: zinc ribbon domain-containing protein [Gaiellaceae bacterium]|nr:zinc ribbon domain-containing protein [Gaiellaceae bacterium]